MIRRRLWDIGLLAPLQSGMREVAMPFLGDIHAATLATVHLAIRDRTQALYLDRLSGRASVPVISTVGSRLPLPATGVRVGKVLLAHAPKEVQEKVLGSLPRLTPYTIIQPARMREQLERIRREGHATTEEEMTFGACSVAVTMRVGADGDVVAAVGVVVPTLKRDRTRLVTALRVAAQGIGRSLEP